MSASSPYPLQEDWYKEFAKGVLNELKEKFESFEKRKVSEAEFQEIYEDYFNSGLDLEAYCKARKYR